MASNDKSGNGRDAKFALGSRDARNTGGKRGLAISSTPHRADPASQGSDPYNTSGSFDRKKNWERVGRR